MVSYVKENKTWEGSGERLVDFWEYLSANSHVEDISYFTHYWDSWHRVERIASGESARRYFNTKEYIFRVPNVFRPKIPMGESCNKGLLHAKHLLHADSLCHFQSAGAISQNGTCSCSVRNETGLHCVPCSGLPESGGPCIGLPGGAYIRCCMDIGGCSTGDEG